ncbi:MAG: hypothetical protein ACRD2L_15680, partial [Terriglobia bacterium]
MSEEEPGQSDDRQKDKEFLKRFKRLVQRKREISEQDIQKDESARSRELEQLDTDIAAALCDLSFTREEIPPGALRQALARFLAKFMEPVTPFNPRQKYGLMTGMFLEPDETYEMAEYYWRTGKYSHAAAAYEHLDGLFGEGLYGPELELSHYLSNMIDVYAKLEDLHRLLQLEARARDAFEARLVSQEDLELAERSLAQVAALRPKELREWDVERIAMNYDRLANELENARFEVERLRGGVLLKEEQTRAREWLAQHHAELMESVMERTRTYLIDAIMCCGHQNLREQFCAWVPVLTGKAIEAEFNSKIWKRIKQALGDGLPQRYRYELSVNQIHTVLSGSGASEMEVSVIST